KVTWVKPELVCTVRFSSWTDDIRLRAPVFQGLRTDIAPEECLREIAAPLSESEAAEAAASRKTALLPEDQNEVVLTVENRRLKFTNLKKVFYPQEGYTKRDVINFYAAVSELILPHL